MEDSSIKKYLLKEEVWNQIPSEVQVQIFLAHQGKALINEYKAIMSNDTVNLVGDMIIGSLTVVSSTKECNRAIAFLTSFFDRLASSTKDEMINKLKNCKNAKKLIFLGSMNH